MAAATCGATALCLGAFLCFLRLFRAYEDYLKAIIKDGPKAKSDEDKERDLSGLNFHFSLALLWALAALLNVPSLMSYAREVEFFGRAVSRLNPDPSLLPAVALSVSLVGTWGEAAPREDAKHYGALSGAVQFLCVLVVLFGSVSTYRVNYALAAAFVAVAAHQLMAPNMTNAEKNELEQKRKEKREKEAGGKLSFFIQWLIVLKQ